MNLSLWLWFRSLEWVNMDELDQLPHDSGIYYAVRQGEILYIGLSGDLWHRWNDDGDRVHHHKMKLLEMGRVRLYFERVEDWRLGYREAIQIKRFNPPMNKRKESIRANVNLDVMLWLVKRWLKIGCFLLGMMLILIASARHFETSILLSVMQNRNVAVCVISMAIAGVIKWQSERSNHA